MKAPLIILTAIAMCCGLNSFADDFNFGQRKAEELLMTKYPKDTAAHAVVLNEWGKGYITERNDRMMLTYQYHVKVKLFDKHGLDDQGNVEIVLYKEDNEHFEEAEEIKGITTYLDENNVPHQVELDSKNIFHTNINKYHDAVKFAMPALKNGCVIEYRYTVISPFIFNFHTWEFQSDIPKVHSEFNANIPAIYNYNIALRGPYKLTKNTGDIQHDCLAVGGVKCDCSDMVYDMDDIPAFKTEDYMTAPKNFMSAITFELSDYTSLVNGAKMKVTKEWKDIDYGLRSSEFFGSQIKRKELMKDRIKECTAGLTDDLARAKAVYAYIRKNIKWNGFYSKYSDDGIRKALDKHTGDIGDINLALIAGLNAAGIPTDAVLLSTRDHGQVNKLYPTESDFNYVVAKTTIGDKTYLLDASEPLLGFGMLPMRCFNDQARVLPMDKPSYWMDLAVPQKRASTTNIELTLQPDGKLKGTYTIYSVGYASYEKRLQIKKYNSVDEYVDHMDERSPRIKILKATINNLDSLESPLSESYEVEINAGKNVNGDQLTFNPFMFGQIKVNPFKLDERTYPVDMGLPSEHRYVLTLHVPDQFTVASGPQDIGLMLPGNTGRLLASFVSDAGTCTYSQIRQFNKAIYATNEYPFLKEMYNKIIQSQQTEIIFRKKS